MFISVTCKIQKETLQTIEPIVLEVNHKFSATVALNVSSDFNRLKDYNHKYVHAEVIFLWRS